MATTTLESATTLLHQLLSAGGAGHRGNLVFFPIMTAMVTPPPDAGDTSSPAPSRMVLINPFSNSMVVLNSDMSEIMMEGGGRAGVPPASKAAIKGLKIVEVGDVIKEQDCPVCLDEYGEKMVVKEMPCKHMFHEECIEKWLGLHGTCPVCRFQLAGEDEKTSEMPVSGEERVSEAVPARGSSEWGQQWERYDHSRAISASNDEQQIGEDHCS